jgi:hypothetical protein
MRVLARSLVLALALGAIPLASVAAHECIVVNRSDTGNAKAAANSDRWVQLNLTYLYERTASFGFPALTPDQVTYATELAVSQGVPYSFTWRTDKTIPMGEGFSHELATDGKGIDHFFEVYGERIIGALFAALANA